MAIYLPARHASFSGNRLSLLRVFGWRTVSRYVTRDLMPSAGLVVSYKFYSQGSACFDQHVFASFSYCGLLS